MKRKEYLHQLSQSELRQLLVERGRHARQQRINNFHRTGKVLPLGLESEYIQVPLEYLNFQERNNPERVRVGKGNRNLFNGVMFFLELSAVLVLFVILFNGMFLLRELNREVVSGFEQPTLTPTPLVVAVVLPSGHTSPISPGGARPNEAEIPEHLRPLMQSLAAIPIPTAAPEHAHRIQIPAMRIDAPVIQGVGWEQLKRGVGQVIGTANPGQNGNMVLAAHNDIFGELFRDLDQLQPGDEFTIYTNQRAYTYTIIGWKIVEPTQVEVMKPTPSPTATLISCYPYLVDNMRIVVTARLVES